jgi:hypothetical protein
MIRELGPQLRGSKAMTTEERLGRIDERLEHLEHELLGNGQAGRCAYHSSSIQSLNRWRSRITGALAVLSLLFFAAITIAGAYITAHPELTGGK